MAGIRIKPGISPDDFLAHISEAAYRVALRHGFKKPFIDMELDLERALRGVMGKDMLVSDLCGLYGVCQEAVNFDLWTPQAEETLSELSV